MIKAKVEMVTAAYFQQRNFSNVELVQVCLDFKHATAILSLTMTIRTAARASTPASHKRYHLPLTLRPSTLVRVNQKEQEKSGGPFLTFHYVLAENRDVSSVPRAQVQQENPDAGQAAALGATGDLLRTAGGGTLGGTALADLPLSWPPLQPRGFQSLWSGSGARYHEILCDGAAGQDHPDGPELPRLRLQFLRVHGVPAAARPARNVAGRWVAPQNI